MKKIRLSVALATLLLVQVGTTTKLEAWELTSPSTWMSDKETLKPITFDLLYPVPFYKTGAFKWTAVAVVAVVGTGVSIATWGGYIRSLCNCSRWTDCRWWIRCLGKQDWQL